MKCPHCQKEIIKKPSQKMKQCKGCYHKVMPNNKTGYCYRCKRGNYNPDTGRWEGGKNEP